jgi:hypothetical protein
MNDKLDILFNLLKNKDKGSYSYHNDIYEEFLENIASNREAFFFLYESMPTDVKPDLLTCSQNFRKTFLNVIEKEDEKTFNSYFFAGMHEFFDLEKIRQLHFKFPGNEKLKEHFKSKDNPQKIDEVVASLSLLWQNNSDHFQDMLEKYKPKLEKLSKINSPQSRAAEHFTHWGRLIIKKHGIDYFINFCKDIKLEPVSFCLNNNQHLGYELEKMTQEQLEFFINYGQNLVDLNYHRFNHSFKAIEAVCGHASLFRSLIKLSEKDNHENLKKFSTIWDTQQEYIKEIFARFIYKSDYQNYSVNYLAKKILEDSFDEKTGYSHNIKIYKKEFQRLVEWGKIAGLESELPKNEGNVQKRINKI